jgi:hypothetical protein
MNIFVVNHSVENCGVYQYGKRFGNIASKSKKYNFMYFEMNSETDLALMYESHKPEVIIYNHLTGTMPWVNEELVSGYRKMGVKQFCIVHNVGYSTFFDYYLHQDPYYKDINENNFSLARPLFDYSPQKIVKKNDDTIRIGSFGFGFRVKYFDEICRIVNEQLPDKNVEINLHLTSSHFCPNANDIQSIKLDCMKFITNSNIALNMTHDFLTDQEMLDFLYGNDLNIFFYQNYGGYNGISSTIDYALSVKKPIAICKSNMFAHIWDVKPSICVEDNYLVDIMNNGFSPLEEKYNSWSNKKFVNKLETIIESVN